MRPGLARPTRFAIAAWAGGIHLGLQAAVYMLGFAVGPKGIGREILGVSLYRIAEILTFPFVPLAERLRWPMFGAFAFPLNSMTWAVAVYFALGLPARDRQPPAATS